MTSPGGPAMTVEALDAPPFPLRVRGLLDGTPSRWLWVVKWLLLIPHYLCLVVLWIAVAIVSVVAFFAILFTGRYPAALFEFTVGVLRWSWRVGYYGYSALGTDRYPPFSLASRPDYPADLEIDRPAHLSRGLVLVKWWLLALPHYLVLAILIGSSSTGRDGTRWSAGIPGGLVGLFVLVLGVSLLFTGRYPGALHGLVVGLDRWALRVAAYALLLTDVYPPFRLDQGGDEDDTTPLPPAGQGPGGVTAPAPHAPLARHGALGVVAILVGVGVLLPGVGGLAVGAVGAGLDSRRDPDGYLSTPYRKVVSGTAAVTAERVVFDAGADDSGEAGVAARLLGDVRVSVTSAGGPVFVGIAPQADVDRWLAGTAHDELVNASGSGLRFQRVLGAGQAPAAQDQTFWTVSTQGEGDLRIDWKPTDGTWALVVARPDGSTGVDASARFGAELPFLARFSAGSLLGGALMTILGAGLVVVGAVLVRPRHRQDPAAGAATPPRVPETSGS